MPKVQTDWTAYQNRQTEKVWKEDYINGRMKELIIEKTAEQVASNSMKPRSRGYVLDPEKNYWNEEPQNPWTPEQQQQDLEKVHEKLKFFGIDIDDEEVRRLFSRYFTG